MDVGSSSDSEGSRSPDLSTPKKTVDSKAFAIFLDDQIKKITEKLKARTD